MTEDAFEGLLTMMIDTHREAERTRRLWARIWWILGVSIGLFVVASMMIEAV